jgi:hypothetical protein
MLTASISLPDLGCVKTHTSPKCGKYNSPTRHRSVGAQYGLTPRRAIASRFSHARGERWSFYTAKTHSGRRAFEGNGSGRSQLSNIYDRSATPSYARDPEGKLLNRQLTPARWRQSLDALPPGGLAPSRRLVERRRGLDRQLPRIGHPILDIHLARNPDVPSLQVAVRPDRGDCPGANYRKDQGQCRSFAHTHRSLYRIGSTHMIAN